MASNDTKLEAAMRNAMKHIDAIAEMGTVNKRDRIEAMKRIERHIIRRQMQFIMVRYGSEEATDATN